MYLPLQSEVKVPCESEQLELSQNGGTQGTEGPGSTGPQDDSHEQQASLPLACADLTPPVSSVRYQPTRVVTAPCQPAEKASQAL